MLGHELTVSPSIRTENLYKNLSYLGDYKDMIGIHTIKIEDADHNL